MLSGILGQNEGGCIELHRKYMSNMPRAARERLIKLIAKAYEAGVGQGELIKSLKGFYGKSQVDALIREGLKRGYCEDKNKGEKLG